MSATAELPIGAVDRVNPVERSDSDRWKNHAGSEEKCNGAEMELQRIFDDATPFAQRRWSRYHEYEAVYAGRYEVTYYYGRSRIQSQALARWTDLISGTLERELTRPRRVIGAEADREEDLEWAEADAAVISGEMLKAGLRRESKDVFQEGVLLGTSGMTWWYERVEDTIRNPRSRQKTTRDDETGEVKVETGEKRRPKFKNRNRIRCEHVSDYDLLYPESCRHPAKGQYLVVRLAWDDARVKAMFKAGKWENDERIQGTLSERGGRVGGGGQVGVHAGTASSIAGGKGVMPVHDANSRTGQRRYKTPFHDVAGQPQYEVLQVWSQHYLYADLDPENPPVECLSYYVNGICVELRENPYGLLPDGSPMRSVTIARTRTVSRQPEGIGVGDRGLEMDLYCTDMLRLAGDAALLEYTPMWKGQVAEGFTVEELRTHPGKYIPLDRGDDITPFSPNQTLAPQAYSFYRSIFGEGSASTGASEALQGMQGKTTSATQFSATHGNALDALESVLTNYEDWMVENGEVVQCLIGQYYDDEMVVNVAGSRYPEFMTIDPSDVGGRCTIRPIGAAEAVRRKQQAKENTAMITTIMGAAANGALPNVDMEAGVRTHLRMLGWPDLDEFIPPTDDLGPGHPDHEHWDLQAGRKVKVHPLDDDMAHLESHLRFQDSDDYLELTITQQNRHTAHVLTHQKQMRQKLQMRLQEAQAKAAAEAQAGGGGGRGPGMAGPPSPAQLQTMDAGGGSGGMMTDGTMGQAAMPQGGAPAQIGAGF